jgi:hypothetical protein
MTAQLRCDCGNLLRIAEHHVGRRVACPGCGKSHLVTADNVSGSQSNVGITLALPAKAKSARPSRRSKWLFLLLAGLLLLGGAGVAWWLRHRETMSDTLAEIDDLSLVPANVQGFGSVRLADLWKTLAMQNAKKKREDDLGQMIERETGLKPEQVERVSGITVEVEHRKRAIVVKIGWTVIRTVAPYDPKVLLSHLTDRQQVPYQDHDYHVGTAADHRTYAVFFAG